MKRILIAVSILLVALSLPLSAETVKGYLIDKMCSAKVAKEGVDATKAHTKDCALMPDCKSSGYGVVNADGKSFESRLLSACPCHPCARHRGSAPRGGRRWPAR